MPAGQTNATGYPDTLDWRARWDLPAATIEELRIERERLRGHIATPEGLARFADVCAEPARRSARQYGIQRDVRIPDDGLRPCGQRGAIK